MYDKAVDALIRRANEVSSQLTHDKDFLELTIRDYEYAISQSEKELSELNEAIWALCPELKQN